MTMIHHLLRSGLAAGALWFGVLAALAQAPNPAPPPVAAQPSAKHILLLYSYGHGSKGVGILDDGFLSVVRDAGVSVNDLYFEYLDLQRHEADKEYPARLLDHLQRQYADRKIDLVITVQQPALNYLLHEGRPLAPGVPVITVQAPAPAAAETDGRRFLCMVAQFDIQGTLARALDLFPETKRVVVISGSSEADKAMAAAAASLAAPYQGRLEFEYTSDLPMEKLLERVASLPPRTIILFTQYNRDTRGLVTLAYEVEARITKVANAPVFGLYDFNLSIGGIGGSVVSVRALGETTGKLALDLLGGKLALTQPVKVMNNEVVPIFDWRQIQRWGGDAGRLPPESRFLNRPPTLWQEYRSTVLTTVIVLLIQSGMIAALLVQRRRRFQAEMALRESRKQYRDLVEGTSDLVTKVDAEGHFLFVNHTALEIYGLAPEACIGRRAFDFVHPDDHAANVAAFQVWLASDRKVFLHENRQVGVDGRVHHLAWAIHAERDERGRVIAFASSARNITERKQAEEALRETKEHLENLIGCANAPIIVWDADGKITRCNHAFEELAGLKAEQVLGKSLEFLFTEEQRERAMGLIRRASAGERFDLVEVPIRHLSGVQRTALWNSAPILGADGRTQVATIAQGQDITGRKQAEAAAKREQDFSNALIAGIPGAFYALDGNGRYVRWNAYQRDEIVGQPEDRIAGVSALETIHPDDRALIQSKIASVLGGGGQETVEGRVLLRGGPAYRWLVMTGRQMMIEGQPFLVGIGIDITERKQAAEALRASEERFHRAVVDAPFPILLHAEDGAVLQASNSWCDITGYTREELATIGDWTERAYGERKALVQADIDALYGLDHRKYEGDYTIRTKAGALRIWDFSSAPLGRLPDGRRLVISMALDVTERRRAEQALEQQAQKLRAQNQELERFNRASVGRELRMIELKQTINELCQKAGLPPRYPAQEKAAANNPGTHE